MLTVEAGNSDYRNQRNRKFMTTVSFIPKNNLYRKPKIQRDTDVLLTDLIQKTHKLSPVES